VDRRSNVEQELVIAEFINMLDRKTASPAFPTNKRQEGTNVLKLAKHFMRNRHQFMDT